MHPNPAFRQSSADANLAFARAQGFGILTLNAAQADSGPMVAHIPFLLSPDGTQVELHLVRSNPIAAALRGGPAPAVLIVSGPDAYISPDWYGVADQVPTWNYVAVHLRGALELLPQDRLEPMLDRLSAAFEARLAPKPPWTSAKMTEGVMARMMRAIVPLRLTVASVDGTWKLGQNKPETVRLDAARHLAGQGAAPALAALMREPPA